MCLHSLLIITIYYALLRLPNAVVQRVDYNHKYPFLEQLKTTHNSDILMSMHGSGLTHLLFLPKWAAVFEIYNCDDVNCYADLARLRGVKYFTWQRQELVKVVYDNGSFINDQPHPKFANYILDKDEFVRLTSEVTFHSTLPFRILVNSKYSKNIEIS
uniref:EGF domain-specific O-linked N-acetylglucosamine transferase n=1 Tax=Syphacia muris TaxID=451379 RepID=A0A0N5ALI0_9BILA